MEEKIIKKNYFDWQGSLLMFFAIFFGLIGISGLVIVISQGTAKIWETNNLIMFLFSSIFTGISFALLKEILK